MMCWTFHQSHRLFPSTYTLPILNSEILKYTCRWKQYSSLLPSSYFPRKPIQINFLSIDLKRKKYSSSSVSYPNAVSVACHSSFFFFENPSVYQISIDIYNISDTVQLLFVPPVSISPQPFPTAVMSKCVCHASECVPRTFSHFWQIITFFFWLSCSMHVLSETKKKNAACYLFVSLSLFTI